MMAETPADISDRVDPTCHPAHWYKRFVACVMAAATLGGVLGSVAGSLVPMYGTIVGGLVGIITGFVVGLCNGTSVRKPLITIFAYSTLGAGVVAGGGVGLSLWMWGWMGPPSRDLFWTVVVAQFSLVTATFLLILWHLDRNARIVWPSPNAVLACVACGYDLRGLTSRTCPECGFVDPREDAA